MRDISAAGLAKLATKLGNESVIIVEIQWTQGGSKMLYGDIDVESEGVRGVIQEVGGLDNVITISGVTQGTTGDSQELSFVMDDIDGEIKNILDSTDVHKRDVWVYQWFKGIPFADKFLLFKGQVSSPLEWHETDRTVRFEVMNQIEDAEVGFSIEEGDFDYVPEDLIGVAWPLLFGTNIHVPALQVRTPYRGVLQTGFGIHDFAKAAKLDQLIHTCCPLVFRGWHIRLNIGGQEADPVFAPEPGCYCQRQADIEQWTNEIALQKTYEFGQIRIIGGSVFPQNQQMTLDICGALVSGKMNGEVFTVTNYEHPQKSELVIPEVRHWNNCGARSLSSYSQSEYPGGSYATRDQVLFAPIQCGDTEDESQLGWKYLSTFPNADFFWAEPGCEVFFVGEEDIVYVVNLLPSTILRVAAWRTYDTGIRELVTVPSSLYTARVTNFNGYMVQEIVFDKLLSRRNEGWEDDIYVSSRSSVGPNTVSILTWLINKYTNFSIDTASFNYVSAKIGTKYPMAVPLLERKNILSVLKDIAFRARCALVLRNDKFFLHYLSEEPSVDFTITEDDVLPGSFVLTHTETEELVTKFVAEWIYDHAKEKPNKAIYRYNLKTYGTQEQDFDFYTYNILELIEKSATFWLIRMGNTWRKVRLRTPMTKLQAEVFDICEVTLPDLSPVPVKCIVEKATYDSEKFEIEFELWTPVRSGETLPFDFAWPANISTQLLWPTVSDLNNGVAGGTGPNVNVKPPPSHPLAQPQGFTANFKQQTNCGQIAGAISDHLNQRCRTDHGDTRPSDLDDTAPGITVPGEDEVDIPTSKNPLGAPNPHTGSLAEEQEKTEAENRETIPHIGGAGDGSDGYESGKPPDGTGEKDAFDLLPEENPLDDCYICYDFYYHRNVTSVFKMAGGGVGNDPGDVGKVRTAETRGDRHVGCFNSLEEGRAQAENWTQIGTSSYNAEVGKPWPHIAALNEWGWSPDCEEPDEEDRTIVSWGDRAGDQDNPDGEDQMFKDIISGTTPFVPDTPP